jgi:energy-coupling factor transporter ATP-binding protein EcfA2
VKGLEHIYMRDTPLAHAALQGVDLVVQAGRAHGLAGVTGSGKSTLLQHMNGLLRPQQGSVRVGSFQLEDAKVQTRDVVKQVGLVFQNPETQFFETYVGDEIAFGPRQLGLDGSLRERVRQAMELVGLDFELFKDRLSFSLSGGEQRKVALACVLAIQPRILLLDEPTAGLDPRAHRDILDRLRQLQSEGVEIVVSSHRMDDLAELVQDLTVMRKGSAVMTGAAASLFEEHDPIYAAGLEQPGAVRAAVRLRELV